MKITDQHAYKNIESEILKRANLKTNFIILSIPGLGESALTRQVAENGKSGEVKYITSENETLSGFNILDVDFYKNKNALLIADKYFKSAKVDQKFGLVVNMPHIVNTQEFKKSSIFAHTYSTYFFKVRDESDSIKIIDDLNSKLSKKDKDRIYELSGGITRLIKYFSANPEKIGLSVDDLLSDKDFNLIIKPTIDAIMLCNDNDLFSFGIKDGNEFTSMVLSRYSELHPWVAKVDIKMADDLSFSESGTNSTERLTKIEKDILTKLIEESLIKREQISDIKWGEGSYDKYSDQAINKSIERINKKLKKHRIVTIPKVGYKLQSV